MFRALHTAASGMLAQQLDLDNIANNLANANTTGFRRRRLEFEDLLYQNLVVSGSAATQQTTVASGLQIGLGTRSASTELVQSQGDLDTTNNPLDLAIEGNGFFQLKMPDGTMAYTRAGTFQLDAQGHVVTADGNPLQPDIAIPLAAFPNPGGLQSEGQNLFTPTTGSGAAILGNPGGPEGLGRIQQGALEE